VNSFKKISQTEGSFGGTLASFATFGRDVDTINDLDGNGVTDLVVGAPQSVPPRKGSVWILFMNNDETVSTQQEITQGVGGFSETLANDDLFGSSVANVGDLDGDNVQDLVVGAPGEGTPSGGGFGHGAVYVLFMNTDGTVKSHTKIANGVTNFGSPLDPGDQFGQSVANMGDLDDDGVNDIAVGADLDDDGSFDAGAVYIVFLNSNGTVKSVQKLSNTAGGAAGLFAQQDQAGISVANIGDLDGNGKNDLVVGGLAGRPGNTSGGEVDILFLDVLGTVINSQQITSGTGGFVGPLEDDDQFAKVENIGDLNGDGINDLAVGTLLDDDGGDDHGAIWILFLNPDGTVKDEQKISDTIGNFGGTLDDDDNFGTSIANVGDLNGDGVTDLAVGAQSDDDGGSGKGAVWILFLNSIECVAPPAQMVSWWPGDGHANDIQDSNPGTLIGDATFANGFVDEAFRFGGTNGYVSAPFTQTGAFTVDFWVKADSTSQPPFTSLFSSSNPGNYDPFFQIDFDNSGNYRFHAGGASPLFVDIGPASTNFQHVAVTYDGASTVKTYLNGVEQNTGNWLGAPLSFEVAKIGTNRDTTSFFDGIIDEVEIFNRVLMQSEIQSIYEAGSAGKCKPCVAPPSSMVSWWPLDEKTGNVAEDIRDANYGTYYDSPTPVAGKVDGALSFDGINDAVKIPASTNLNVGIGPGFTIDAWINPFDLDGAQPLVEWNENIGVASPIGVQLFISFPDDGKLYANIVDTGGGSHTIATDSPVISANTFQHVALTYDKDSGVATLYKDGAIVKQDNLGSFTPQTSFDLFFGERPYPPGLVAYYQGIMDEVELFDRALSQSEIQSIYYAGSAGKCKSCITPPSGLINWWDGDSVSGSIASDIIGNNNGIMSFGTTTVPGKVGNAFHFDGMNDDIIIPAGVFGGTSELTIDAWIKTDSANPPGEFQAIVSAVASEFVHFQANDGFGVIAVYTSGGPVSSFSLPTISEVPTGVYRHVAISIKSGDSRLYVDGALVGQNPATFSTITPTDDLHIGSGSGNQRYFHGDIDEVEIFNRALLQSEIEDIYNAGFHGKCKDPTLKITKNTIGGDASFDFDVDYGSANIVVADTDNDRVQVFDSAGVFLFEFDGSDSSEPFSSPRDIAIDSFGRIIVSDFSNHKVKVFDSAGAFVFEFDGSNSPEPFVQPFGVAVDDSDNIYVADRGNNKVKVFNSAGGFLFEVNPAGPNSLSLPQGVTVDEFGRIIVADTDNDKVKVFNSAGGFLFEVNPVGSTDNSFDSPTGVAVDNANNILVADIFHNIIKIFDSSGGFVSEFGSVGSGAGQFDVPVGITTDRFGKILVTDSDNNRVQLFDSGGGFLSEFGSFGGGSGEFSDPFGIEVVLTQSEADIPNTSTNNMFGPVEILPGTLDVTENVPVGWNLLNADCTINGISQSGTTGLTVSLADEVICTFTDESTSATLKIIKNAIGGDDSFDFSGEDGLGPLPPITINTAGIPMFGPFPITPGDLDVFEDVPAGWVLDFAECTINGGPPGPTDGLLIDPGDEVVCTFTNEFTGGGGGGDTIPPVVTPPPDQVVVVIGPTSTTVNFPSPGATDNVGVTTGPTCNPPSGSVFSVGTTIVTCTAEDAAGNVGQATFEVTIQGSGGSASGTGNGNVPCDKTTSPTQYCFKLSGR